MRCIGDTIYKIIFHQSIVTFKFDVKSHEQICVVQCCFAIVGCSNESDD
jgi:hypothetical protein